MNEHASSQRPNDVLFAELHRLTTGLREQTISAGDAQRLESLVCTNPAARDLYLLLTLESLELSRWARHPALSAADLARSAWEQETEVESRLRRIWEAAYDFISNYTTLAALVSGLFVTTVVLSLALWPVPESKLAAPAADVPSTEFVARISGSQQATFDATSDGNLKNRDLFDDDKIMLASGLLVIEYDTGARVTLEGPATYHVNGANGGDLRVGKLAANVPQQATGFAVATPFATVTDLGTEFGVIVSDDTTDVAVYQGEVRMEVTGSSGRPQALRLTAGVVGQANRSGKLTTVSGTTEQLAIVRDISRDFKNGSMVATSLKGSLLNRTVGQTVNGFTVALATADSTLVTDGSINIDNRTLTGLVNAGKKFTLERVCFDSAGSTATWNITNAAAAGTKLFFFTSDVDNGGESVIITNGTDPIAFSSLLGGFQIDNNTVYTTGQMDGFFDQSSGTLNAMTADNTNPIAVWDVTGLTQVTWTPNKVGQQAGFFTVHPILPVTKSARSGPQP